ncbi:MAG: DUF11 domain-containing protein [Candidatus Nitrosopelagicus sp.]|nr:DUF11 domain-containing protein [Candidatus Nitrosopelagicus sp.]
MRNCIILFGLIFILGIGLVHDIYAPSPPTPPSQADLTITTELNSSTLTNGFPIKDQHFNYTITVTNNGPASASDVEVVDIIPSLLSVVRAPSFCTLSSQTETCQLGTITSGSSEIIEIEVATSSVGAIENKANVTSSTYDKTPQGFAFSKIFKSLTGAGEVAVDSSNNVYVGEQSTNVLYKYNIHGTQLASRSGSFAGQLSEIDFDTSGNVLIADRVASPNDRVVKLNSGLTPLTEIILLVG